MLLHIIKTFELFWLNKDKTRLTWQMCSICDLFCSCDNERFTNNNLVTNRVSASCMQDVMHRYFILPKCLRKNTSSIHYISKQSYSSTLESYTWQLIVNHLLSSQLISYLCYCYVKINGYTKLNMAKTNDFVKSMKCIVSVSKCVKWIIQS